MYQLTKFGAVILTAAALACWPATVRADHKVRYKDRVSGTALATGFTPPILTQILTGGGEGTHLGAFTAEGQENLHFNTPYGGLVEDGVFEYTAADGSTISGTFFGTFEITDTGRELDLFLVVEGGTGRLDRVTGGFIETQVTGTATDNPLELEFTYTSDGYLMFSDDRP